MKILMIGNEVLRFAYTPKAIQKDELIQAGDNAVPYSSTDRVRLAHNPMPENPPGKPIKLNRINRLF